MKTTFTPQARSTKFVLSLFFISLLSFSCFAFNATAEICDNLTDGGEIAYDQTVCNPGDAPEQFENITLPSGGSGEVEYIWIYTTDDPNNQTANWITIPGSTSEYYQAGPVFVNTWFRRCARNLGCTDYVVESNWLMICVDFEAPHFTYVPEHYEANCNDYIEFGDPAFGDDCDSAVNLNYEDGISEEDCLTYHIRTWTITDACGKEDFANQVITTIDTEAPTISLNAPYDDLYNGETIYYSCYEVPILDETYATAIDNCDDDVEIYFIDNFYATGNCIEDGYLEAYECIWTATDNCGNQSTFTIFIHVRDDEDPVFTYIPQDEEVSCNEDPIFTQPEYTDNCDQDLDLQVDYESSIDDCTTSHTTTWTITDDCGNHTTASQTINITDNEAPHISLNSPLEGVSNGDTLIFECIMDFLLDEASVTVTDNCDSNPHVVFYDDWYSSNNCIEDGYLEKMECSWTATDECGNESIFVIYILIVDRTAPVFTHVPENISGDCNQDPNFGEPSYEDNCEGQVTLSHEDKIEDLNCGYSATRVWTITDACGNQNTASQTVNLVDTTAPTLSLNGPTGPLNNGDVVTFDCNDYFYFDENSIIVSDNCDDNPSVTFIDEIISSGDCLLDGYLQLFNCTWLAIDDCGNESAFSIQVKIVDLSPPVVVNHPIDKVIDCDGDPTFGEPLFRDNCDNDLDIQVSDSVLEEPCKTTYTKTWTAIDDCGNHATTTQRIITEDNEAPTVHLGGSYEEVMDGDTLWFNCNDIYYFLEDDAVAYDNCDDMPTVTFYDDYQESDNCLEDGYLAKAYCTWTAFDDCGNESSFSIFIYVIDDEDPVFTFVPEDLDLECTADPELTGEPLFEDNCDDDLTVEYEMKIIQDDCYFKYVRVWVVTDDCGNSARAAQVIYISDNEAPVVLQLNLVTGSDCHHDIIINEPTVSDNCDPDPNIHAQVDTIYGLDFVDFKINWTITDNCGNVTTAYQAATIPCTDGFNFMDVEASRIGRNSVNISWEVVNDNMGANYVIETSADGVNFITENAIISTFGDAYLGDNRYSFEIDDHYSGRSYYRVRYIETDGQATLSDMDELNEFDIQTQALIYPNPVHTSATIEFLNPIDALSTIKIYDLRGAQVKNIAVAPGDLQIQINFEELEAGIYLVHYQMNGINYIQRFVKVD